MPPIHPLELPEIVERVGHFLPLWVREHAEETGLVETLFKPQTFQACILVSRLWYQTLLPILWADYDAGDMVDIPAHIFTHHHPHFRTFHMQRGQRALTVGCTRLVDLTLNAETGDLVNLRRLIRSNPGLKTLAWNGPGGSRLLKATDFAQLPQLENLTISQWDVSRGRLPRALMPLAGSLKTLFIGWVMGLNKGGFFGHLSSDDGGDESEGEEEVVEEEDLLGQGAAAGGEDAQVDGKDIRDTFMLPMLESYIAVTASPYAPDPAEFVKYCPNLVRLELTLAPDGNAVDIKRISNSLRDYCPKLRAFAVRGTIEQEDKEMLIRNCTAAGLSELIITYSCVKESTIDAVAVHASILETLGVFNPVDDDAALDHIFHLPVRCPRLKWFSVSVWRCPVSHKVILEALKTSSSSWQRSGLERLDLEILTPDEEHSYDDDQDVVPMTKIFEGGQGFMGWYYHPDGPSSSDEYEFCLTEAFVRDMFESVGGLENLRMLTWSGYIFIRSRHRSSAKCDSLPFVYFSD